MSKVRHIGVFGRRNTGKSSLINILVGQDVAIVSNVPGTTTDPVRKRMEINGLGPVVFIDTAGIDDSGVLGEQRVEKTKSVIKIIDLAILIFTNNQIEKYELDLISSFREEGIPFIMLHNQSDIVSLDPELALDLSEKENIDVLEFSCSLLDEEDQKKAVDTLISMIVFELQKSEAVSKTILEGLVEKGDHIVLVCPIDSEAPEGRLILPQVNAIRDALDRKAVAIVIQPEQLGDYLKYLSVKPKLVVTDSQVFEMVSKIVPEDIPLTGFSLLLARVKGAFQYYLNGIYSIDNLKDGDKILILESCTHHATCDDIGRVKIPNLLKKKSGKQLTFDIVGGLDTLPEDICNYSMVIQCGGCMITDRQLQSRLRPAIKAGIPVANYGMVIAYCTGIYDRAIEPLKQKDQ
ncbi:MAG: [FeFe] hydrogenase H-cluster maturation GTPase HydF [Bacteroidales bacterium]|jgi:[FeFe] hydrogenase H-cluster maturation GTPase HydF|nr:[FeFe] hydrogenase H-cluster maturation GTPase HydF [Bacteroidales bacterium]